MAKSCKGLAMELVKCLSESDCVKATPVVTIYEDVTDYSFVWDSDGNESCNQHGVVNDPILNIWKEGGPSMNWCKNQSCKTCSFTSCLFFEVEKRSYRECAGEKVPSISSECVGLRETYFNCKRGQVDMRARIRGNKGY